MRAFMIGVLGVGLVSACAPGVPDSASSVGLDTSIQAEQAGEAALTTGQALPPSAAIFRESLGPSTQPSIELQQALPGSAVAPGAPLNATDVTAPVTPGTTAGAVGDIAADTAAVLAATSATPAGAAPQINNPGISDENDFNAVSDRQSIESDAQRLQQQASQRQVIQPTALPERSATGLNIVTYALSTNHDRGTRIYSRSGVNLTQRSLRACANYPSPDQAQIAFLEAGGPDRDRLTLDPDGDGYACAWDPAPFRAAVRG